MSASRAVVVPTPNGCVTGAMLAGIG